MPKYFLDIMRVAAIIIAAFSVASFLPPFHLIAGDTIVPQLLLLSFVMAFMINRALSRKQALAGSVMIELSRLRRLEHLSESMSDAKFHRDLKTAIGRYQQLMSKSFGRKDDTADEFRDITHLVYRFRPGAGQDVIYADLLGTTRDLALERQRLASSMQAPLSPYSWLLVLVNATFVILFLLANRRPDVASHYGAAATISGVLIALDLLFQTDRLSPREIKRYREMFRKNMPKEKK